MEKSFEHRTRVFNANEVDALREIAALVENIPLPARREANSWPFAHVLQERPAIGQRLMAVFCASSCDDWARGFFPDGYVFMIRYCAFRYHEPSNTKSHLPLHVDANFIGPDRRVMNFWVPVTDVTAETPGLRFLRPDIDPEPVQRRWAAQYTAARRANPDRVPSLTFSAEDLAKTFGRPIDECFVVPRMQAGDALAFHQFIVHGTEANFGGTRRSFEFRVCGANAVPREYNGHVAIPSRSGDRWAFELRKVDRGAAAEA